MQPSSMKRAALAAALCVLPVCALAQTYPVKPVRIIVGFAPGGGTDIMARAVSLGADVVASSPEATAAIFKTDIAKFTKVAQAAKISAD